ncbi:hypothetical protein [Nitrosomonas sp. Nm58]|uniref:hypothetical protein n=1 Tax=Nitrosomonas sp. Nm58 TaxID=200126 RepID=UPI00115FF4CC|nr:hypothetical protein [Nitrosomonas sp. Nm58]
MISAPNLLPLPWPAKWDIARYSHLCGNDETASSKYLSGTYAQPSLLLGSARNFSSSSQWTMSGPIVATMRRCSESVEAEIYAERDHH